jgi:hypothetical protein
LLEDTYGPYKKALADNFEEGFEKLLEEDGHSTRSYMRTEMK